MEYENLLVSVQEYFNNCKIIIDEESLPNDIEKAVNENDELYSHIQSEFSNIDFISKIKERDSKLLTISPRSNDWYVRNIINPIHKSQHIANVYTHFEIIHKYMNDGYIISHISNNKYNKTICVGDKINWKNSSSRYNGSDHIVKKIILYNDIHTPNFSIVCSDHFKSIKRPFIAVLTDQGNSFPADWIII